LPERVDADNELPGRGKMKIGQVQKRSRLWHWLLHTSEQNHETFGCRCCVPRLKIKLMVS